MVRQRPATHLFTIVVAVAALCFVVLIERGESQAAPGAPNIEFRPGGYFPAHFPLHGKVRLLTAPVVEMGRRHRHRVEYTVGDIAVEAGMAIEVWKHFTSDVEEFQIDNPDAPAWFGVEIARPGVTARTKRYSNWVQRNEVNVFPYRKTAAVLIDQGSLNKGDRVIFDLGGPAGVRMQHYEENLFNFRFVITRDEKVVAYGGDAALKVTGGPLKKLRVQAPSVVKVGEPFPVEIVPMDEWSSQAKNGAGLAFRVRAGDVNGGTFRYDENLQHYVARDVIARSEGVLRIEIETADGQFRGVSNPVWVKRDVVERIYFGELHQHTYLHDGRGVFEELYLYGRRVGLLDFGAVTPHHMPMSVTGPNFYLDKRYPVEEWPNLQKVTQELNGWQNLVTLLGYEYSVGTQAGGHHNIFYNADRAASTMQLDPDNPMAPIGQMLRTLKLARVPTLVIPHIGGGPPDWSHPTDPRIERLFEIASVHGVFEESWQRHLAHGLRLGASAAGDTHTTSMGIAYPGLNYVNTNALTGVYAFRKDRQSLWNGLYEKRTFATTGNQRILVDFKVNGEPMGGEISSAMAQTARLVGRIAGAAPLLSVQLVKNNAVIHTLRPSRRNGNLLRVVWGDNIYQRRAAVGLRTGRLRSSGGALRLHRALHIDQAFEEVRQDGGAIAWKTAAVSNDRDGFLAGIEGVTGEELVFTLDDEDTIGQIDLRIPVRQLREKGVYSARVGAGSRVNHPYMKMMEVEPAFFLECELVDENGPLDIDVQFEDRTPPKPGDFYYLRAEQLDTNKAWSSPVWVN